MRCLIFSLCFSLPAVVAAEGAVRTLDCTVAQQCDASGNCAVSEEAIRFQLEPIELQPDGSGRYVISYDDSRAEAAAGSDLGPFIWVHAEERHVLVVSSEVSWLWHRLSMGPEPAASIRFLECAYQG